MRLKPFDISDVVATSREVADLDAALRRQRDLTARAFAQGFTAAVEGLKGVHEHVAEWAEYFKERSCSPS